MFKIMIILRGSKIASDFAETFPSQVFQSILSQFSYAKPLVDHMDPQFPKDYQVFFKENDLNLNHFQFKANFFIFRLFL